MSNRQTSEMIYVWDPFVRIFHWTLVLVFAVAYLSGDDFQSVHVWAGYIVGTLVLMRIVWGFVGPRHARFTDFIYRPSTIFAYGRDLILFKAPRHLGHSPGGGAMVIALIVLLSITVITGLVVYGGDQQAGPLAGIVSKETGESLEEFHELIANVTLGFVLAHIAAVVLASFVHRESLVRAMITGYKRR